jgi:putative ATP-dependent endonuclease of OLD family
MVLLGENNAGKTSFLAALDVALGNAKAREEDLRQDQNGKAATRFCVDVLGLPAKDDSFPEGVAQVLGAAVQIKKNEPEFFAIRCRAEIDAKRGELTFKRTFLKGWARTRADAELLTELSNVTVTREARELITFNLLDARRDGVEQLRNKRTFWGQIVSDLRLAAELRKDVEATLRELREKIVAGSPPLVALQQELKDIGSVIAHPQLDVEVSPLPGDVEDLLRATDLLLTESGQRALPIGMQGMGTRSLSALLIFRAYVRAVLSMTKGPGTLSLSAFEEPEAHLHPQAQRAVLNVIQQIPGQRIISTHSPFVAAIADVYDVRLFRRGRDGTTVAWVPEANLQTGATTFDDEALAQLRRFVQRRHGEILFARVVGLFEGDTEDAALPIFARVHWPSGPDSVGVSLVNVGGAGNYKHVLRLIEALRIPWVVLSDGDQAGVDGVAAAGKALGRILDETSPEVVMLPKGNDFEAQILAEGFRPHAERAIANFFGAAALADYRAKNHGQKGHGGTLRDYQSAGWEDRLVADFMDRHKGTYGAALADEIVSANKMPSHVVTFLSKIDTILRANP